MWCWSVSLATLSAPMAQQTTAIAAAVANVKHTAKIRFLLMIIKLSPSFSLKDHNELKSITKYK